MALDLNIIEVQSKIILDEFLLDAKLKAIGTIDDSINNEDYGYVTVLNGVATPWRQVNPLKPIGYAEGVLKIADIFMIYPVDPEIQAKIKKMPRAERGIFYIGHFAVHANLTMGMETTLAGVMDAVTKRFMAITDVSVFPMFPANAAMPEHMPIALLNRAKVQHYHSSTD